MIKKFSFIIFKLIEFIDFILKKTINKTFIVYLNGQLIKKTYKSRNILGKKINFFTPNELTYSRVVNFFDSEPETLEWIDSFDKDKKIIFWDIGANIGLYSIYNALKNRHSETISFEPSSSNLRVFTRNISINNLENNIKLFPIPLTNKQNSFLIMREGDFIEGGALNSFGENFNFEGKKFESKMKYNLYGTTINYLINNQILKVPNYIKIDVDGIEHLILEGADQFLSDSKIKSLSIEINENFNDQLNKVLDIMKKNGFKILHKKQNKELSLNEGKFSETFNYIFIR